MRKSLPKFLAAAALSWPTLVLAQEPSIFDQLDTNKDGVVSKDEVPEEKRGLFERMVRLGDKNSDGKLSREEFSNATKPAEGERQGRGEGRGEGGRPDPQRVFAAMDKDNDGKVSKEEAQGPLKENFARFDANNDGFVDGTELRQAFEKMAGRPGGAEGRRQEPSQFEAIFAKLDANSDGKLTADEVPEEHKEKFNQMRERLNLGQDGGVTKEQFVRAATALAASREGGAGDARGEGARRPDGDPRPEAGRRPEGSPDGARGGFPFPAGPLMSVIDTNHDGELSPEEIANASANLAKLDKDGDGKITRTEMMPMRGEGGPPPGAVGNPEEMLRRLMQADRNSDGRLDKEETPEFLRRMFERIDANSDGYLDETELKQMQARMREGGGRPGEPERRREGDARRPEGDGARRPEGETRRPDGERKREGERRPEGDRKPEGERKPDGERRRSDG